MKKTKIIAITTMLVSLIFVLIGVGAVILFSIGNQKEYTITNVYIQTELNTISTDNGYKTTTKYI